jgi:hypothetical protein
MCSGGSCDIGFRIHERGAKKESQIHGRSLCRRLGGNTEPATPAKSFPFGTAIVVIDGSPYRRWCARPGGFRAQPKITALKVLGWHDVSVLVRPSEVSTQGTSGGKRRYRLRSSNSSAVKFTRKEIVYKPTSVSRRVCSCRVYASTVHCTSAQAGVVEL